MFKAIKVSENVYWVGAIDWNLRNFHGYSTKRGSTYNAFLVLADKVTLVDTVKAPFKDEMLSRIASVIDPKKIDYIVSNHAEMDHSGCIPAMLHTIKPEKVFASTMGAKALKDHFQIDSIIPVKSGDILDLGNMQLNFIETRMLHWPDSMFTYLEQDGVIFTQDAFGMHLASSERFSDELDKAVLEEEMLTYYANILLPYSAQVEKILGQLEASGIQPKVICPDHGPLFRGGLADLIAKYRSWAGQQPVKRAVILYDTMWNSTEKMARAIEDGLIEGGAAVKLLRMSETERSVLAYEIMNAGALIVGSPTLNNNIFPAMADGLTYLRGLRPQNKIGACFGSFGWGGEAVKQLSDYLDSMKIRQVADPVRIKYVPEDLSSCRELGLLVAKELAAP